MNVDRLVEQAREVSSGHGQWDTGGANYVRSLLAGLADAVEQLRTECDEWRATVDMMGTAFLNDLGTDPESYERFKDSVEFWRLRANNLDRFKAAVERDRDEARESDKQLAALLDASRDQGPCPECELLGYRTCDCMEVSDDPSRTGDIHRSE